MHCTMSTTYFFLVVASPTKSQTVITSDTFLGSTGLASDLAYLTGCVQSELHRLPHLPHGVRNCKSHEISVFDSVSCPSKQLDDYYHLDQ
ncbi:hypothetical protein BCR39DRAFT_550337 [Naematelia encephala]|uniref:Uncharacterized protein n=1 Tax=Naematelia encephala TaxID=71784 RepID=A0A1Y2AKA2_9TREE|nr:hypothetical protein BCR39DRAFT_550337 [Naematelia encephala]